MSQKEKLNWVHCEKCNRWEIFENCGLGEKYDEKVVRKCKFECRFCKLEEKQTECFSVIESEVAGMRDRLNEIEGRLAEIEREYAKVEEKSNKHVAEVVQIGEKLKELEDVSANNESKLSVAEIKSDEQMQGIGKSLNEVKDNIKALEIKIEEIKEEWPTPNEWIRVGRKRKAEMRPSKIGEEQGVTRKVSFAEKFKDRPNDTVLVIGDSLARAAGKKLEANSNMFTSRSIGGAKISDIASEVEKLEGSDHRHLVVVVGTNNLKCDLSVKLMKDYESLVRKCKEVRNRKVTLMGIPRRYDIGLEYESRRYNANLKLEKMCKKEGVEFLLFETARSRLARDGLHFNNLGQEEMAQAIFKHCRGFLD